MDGVGRWGMGRWGMGRWGEKMGYGRRRVACSLLRAAAAGRGLRGEVSGEGVVGNKMVGTYVIYEPTNMLSSDVRRVRDSNPRYP